MTGTTPRAEEADVPGTRRTWWFPDGDLPDPVEGDRFVAHEALIVLNPASQPATVRLTLYRTDRAPTLLDGEIVVGPERVRCVRLDRLAEAGIDATIPYRTQYALRLDSTVGVFCQYGRLDTAQPNLTLMTAPAFG